MKVLLCRDIEKLGWLGDIVEVNDGYARNYLLPQQLAISPTEANVKSLADAKVRRAQERTLALEKLKQVVAAVDGAEAVVAAKANERGHLFGSVAERDIAGNLREQGFEVSDDMVQLSEHIKEVGAHEVKLKLAADLFATVSVVVVSQDGTIDSIDKDITE
ncbi:MAG: 50S ribosomal protein L9 [Planctomycetota bacterium]|nr:MAG: 50S ribosomal protein L9 [Planctomycetota bacterium]